MKKKTLVLASNNEHKILEIKDMLGEAYQVLKQAEFNIGPTPETGKSFKENAIIKAREIHKITGLSTNLYKINAGKTQRYPKNLS